MRWRGLITLLGLIAAGCSTLAPQAPQEVVALRSPPAIAPAVTLRRARATADADVWPTIRSGLVLRGESHARIDAAVRYFTSHPRLIAALEPDLRRYYAFLVAEVGRRGLPMEIALLPIVESTLNPYALSRAGAAGLWQLMPDTAARYGVAIDWWYDGRRDPVDSTRAALDHLEYLRGRFDGDWLLVMAAYNCGEGCVARAQRVAQTASYWALDLPRETEEYVPRILALARLVAAPDAFGLQLPTIDPTPAFAMARLDGQVDLGEIARLTALGNDELFRLNPGLNRRATPPEGPHRLLLPAALASSFDALLAEYPADAERWVPYVVRPGDTLSGIASRHQASIDAIRANNAIKGNLIHAGATLVIPISARGTLPENPLLAAQSNRPRYRAYRVAAGDSLWTLSKRFDTSVAALLQANGMSARTPLRVGQSLRIPAKAGAQRTIEYHVRKGDSLWQIANRFKVSVAQIVRWNDLSPDATLHPGARLTLEI
jgi:membrane-bound lytic murein transglycosylase D